MWGAVVGGAGFVSDSRTSSVGSAASLEGRVTDVRFVGWEVDSITHPWTVVDLFRKNPVSVPIPFLHLGCINQALF